jgi:hypothetical protein
MRVSGLWGGVVEWGRGEGSHEEDSGWKRVRDAVAGVTGPAVKGMKGLGKAWVKKWKEWWGGSRGQGQGQGLGRRVLQRRGDRRRGESRREGLWRSRRRWV